MICISCKEFCNEFRGKYFCSMCISIDQFRKEKLNENKTRPQIFMGNRPIDNNMECDWNYTAFCTDFYSFTSPERKAENNEDEDEISDDWDEEEMQLAFSKSCQISKHDNKFTRESKSHIADDGDEDLFIEINTKNVMPVPPSNPKKVYLEDFDNFTIK
ncbi:hypothetical protein BYT27DRAFT_7216738 [Phlegmacium glaucopus]|nr:hypothetical protein BYT27DRAFT_7216738 [Phlegmacium glaucopus]